ncbi:MAG: ThiF family adenylyltransferase [bacterium]|nr:ThiF family adenylyltransferase [bacterium]
MISQTRSGSGITVAVVGAGGNIGSHLVPHLGRCDGLSGVILVDPDHYTVANLRTQAFPGVDVGQTKADVQARRLRNINPHLDVTSIPEEIERLPWGRLSADILLSCVDSRATRLYMNLVACRLNLPWIDAGVGGNANLARVTVLAPGAGRPCFECSWDERDYAAVESRYSCNHANEDGSTAAVSTSSLGAAVAALQIFELERWLGGGDALGTELVIDLKSRNFFPSRLDFNPSCRMSHESIEIERIEHSPEELSVNAALVKLGDDIDAPLNETWLRVTRSWFATQLTCVECGHVRQELLLAASLTDDDLRCQVCGERTVPAGIDRIDTSHPDPVLNSSLADAGLRSGDVVTVGTQAKEKHYELA